MLQIDFCTGNKSKLKEANDYINSKVKDVSLYSNKIDFTEIQSISQQEILLDKMKQAISKTDRPFIIDETGIYFNKYNNYPGTLTKYVVKSLGIEGIKRFTRDLTTLSSSILLLTVSLDNSIVNPGICLFSFIKP